jgi:SAM-dependent methyltransferase
VYAGQAPRLAGAELAAFGESVLSACPRDVAEVRIGGVPYVGFATDPALSGADLRHLANLSAAYALFVVEGDLLRPVQLAPRAVYDEDLITIPKYAGKTNEQFTKLLLNVTVLASTYGPVMLERRLVVLDPLCGRGTTLNQALRYGYDALGIEIDGAHVDAYGAFLRTWLRRKRLKHTVEAAPVRRERRVVARRLTATVAPDRDAHRAGDVQRLTLLQADATRARELLRAGCCDVIVTDLPYGVTHGASTAGSGGRSRSPRELLRAALPGWAELLRHGGAIGISFNTHVLGRDDAATVLAGAGLDVVATPAYGRFAHRVDQAIARDVLVARRP